MKKIQKNLLLVLTAFVMLTLHSCVTQAQMYQRGPANVIVPPWAPPYENSASVHYYYFPDLEIYYDVWESEFIYLEAGNWRFSPVLPPYLGNINLYDAYVVMLNGRVHEPWRFHQQYLVHYPRNYYHTFPDNVRRENLRGYNENMRVNVYAPRHIDADRPVNPIRTTPSNREPQRVQYGGSNLGQPVPVQPNMTNPNRGNQDRGRDGGDRHGNRDGGERH